MVAYRTPLHVSSFQISFQLRPLGLSDWTLLNMRQMPTVRRLLWLYLEEVVMINGR